MLPSIVTGFNCYWTPNTANSTAIQLDAQGQPSDHTVMFAFNSGTVMVRRYCDEKKTASRMIVNLCCSIKYSAFRKTGEVRNYRRKTGETASIFFPDSIFALITIVFHEALFSTARKISELNIFSSKYYFWCWWWNCWLRLLRSPSSTCSLWSSWCSRAQRWNSSRLRKLHVSNCFAEDSREITIGTTSRGVGKCKIGWRNGKTAVNENFY